MSNEEAKIPENTDWNSTQLKDETNTSLTVQDIKQLLITRGANKKQLKGRKTDLIKLLKNKYPIVPSTKLKYLSVVELQAELKLRGIDHKCLEKDELIARFINKDCQWIEIEGIILRRDKKLFGGTIFNIIPINDNEFYLMSGKRGIVNEICKYNAIQNKWESWRIDYHINNYESSFHPCFNPIDKSIYIYHNGTLFTFKFETECIRKITDLLLYNTLCRRPPVFINNKMHFVDEKHLILNVSDASYKLDICSSFDKVDDDDDDYGLGQLAHNQSSKSVYYVSCNGVYSYNSISNQWSNVNVKMPPTTFMSYNLCVITYDERYILNFECPDIHVIDLKLKKCFKSNIVAPFSVGWCSNYNYGAVIIKNNVRTELITFGFVRKCWDEYEIGLDIFPPKYIVKLIQLWLVYEDVHLLYDNKHENHLCHWKMSVENIIIDK
eukprot:292614_1